MKGRLRLSCRFSALGFERSLLVFIHTCRTYTGGPRCQEILWRAGVCGWGGGGGGGQGQASVPGRKEVDLTDGFQISTSLIRL